MFDDFHLLVGHCVRCKVELVFSVPLVVGDLMLLDRGSCNLFCPSRAPYSPVYIHHHIGQFIF